METERSHEETETHRVIEGDGAFARISVQESEKKVFIEDIESEQTGQGAGSQLLNTIKTEYPDYSIEGIAMPYDRQNPHEEVKEEDIEKVILLESEADYRTLSDAEKEFVARIRQQHKSQSTFDPFTRLIKFYRENNFEIGVGGHFFSQPPHQLRKV